MVPLCRVGDAESGLSSRVQGRFRVFPDNGSDFDFQDRYLQRDIPAIRSQIIMGDAYTTGETFDSVNVRGKMFYLSDLLLHVIGFG